MIEKNTSKNEKQNPVPLKDLDIIFASEYEIDEFAYELIKILLGIEALFISDLSKFTDFLIPSSYPGHEKVRFSELSEEEKKLYPWVNEECSEENRLKLIVDFPPISDEEIDLYFENEEKILIHQIEQTFGISMNHYPVDEGLYVWKVTKYIINKQTELKQKFDKI